jgi:hypothetical protein
MYETGCAVAHEQAEGRMDLSSKFHIWMKFSANVTKGFPLYVFGTRHCPDAVCFHRDVLQGHGFKNYTMVCGRHLGDIVCCLHVFRWISYNILSSIEGVVVALLVVNVGSFEPVIHIHL